MTLLLTSIGQDDKLWIVCRLHDHDAFFVRQQKRNAGKYGISPPDLQAVKPQRRINMRCKKLVLVFCMLYAAVILASCDSQPELTYTFENNSDYNVTVTLNFAYHSETYTENENRIESTDSFSVYSNSSAIVYIASKSVDFQWRADGYTQNVYCEASGTKAVFNNR